jgi:hypothetical protein
MKLVVKEDGYKLKCSPPIWTIIFFHPKKMYNTPQVQGFFFSYMNMSLFLHKKMRNFFFSSVKFATFTEKLKKLAKIFHMKK